MLLRREILAQERTFRESISRAESGLSGVVPVLDSAALLPLSGSYGSGEAQLPNK